MIKHELYAYDKFNINNSVAAQDESTQTLYISNKYLYQYQQFDLHIY